jgi:hypothetical protein
MMTRRHFEALTGAITLAFGVAVIVSSIQVGAGWDGGDVQSGTFPLLAGSLVAAGSLYNLVQAFLGPNPVIARPDELRRVASLFLPALGFVALIPLLGIYASGVGYLLWSLRIQHKMAWTRSAAIAAGAALALYFTIERAFQVLLPHGWLGAKLGF